MAALAIVGAVISAVAAVRQGQAAANAETYNAQVAEQNKQIAESQGIAASEAQKRESQRRMGAALAAYGAAGVSTSDGSPTEVLAESARMAELDNLTLKYNYRLKGLGYSNQVELSKANAVNSRTAGYLNAYGSLANSGANIAGNFG